MEAEWITLRETARRLGIMPTTAYRVIPAAGIRKRVLPGTFPKYNAADVARVAAQAVQGGGPESGRAAG
jgi:hypothetical protein